MKFHSGVAVVVVESNKILIIKSAGADRDWVSVLLKTL